MNKFIKWTGFICIGFFALIVLTTIANSQQPLYCKPMEVMVAQLKGDGVFPTWLGVVNPGMVVSLLTHPEEGERWAIISIEANGKACVRAAGPNWFKMPVEEKGRKALQ